VNELKQPWGEPTAAPADWYNDPDNPGTKRYWDGKQWTQQSRLSGVEVADDIAEPSHATLPFKSGFTAILLMLVGTALIPLLLLGGENSPFTSNAGLVVVAGLSYAPATIWCWQQLRKSPQSLFRWSDLAIGPATWITVVFIQGVTAIVLLTLNIPTASNVQDSTSDGSGVDYSLGVGALIIVAVIFAPICEEIIFRGVLMRALLSRTHVAVALVTQGIVFGVAHINPAFGSGNIGLTIILSVVGICFGYVAWWRKSIGVSIVAHALFNGAVVIVTTTGLLEMLQEQSDFGQIFNAFVRATIPGIS
jgi:uncharacterized protein